MQPPELPFLLPEKGVIKIYKVNYGRTSSSVCSQNQAASVLAKTDCLSNQFTYVNQSKPDTVPVVYRSCGNKIICTVTVKNFADPCGGTYKYLETSYACVYDYDLYYIPEKKTWDEALGLCRKNYSDLLYIAQPDVLRQVNTLFGAASGEVFPEGGVWIGLQRSVSQGYLDWHWANGTSVEFNMWDSGFPTDPLFQHCVRLDYNSTGHMVWNAACCEEQLPFICQD
ncbi:C-type mannose receptor 2-like [Lepisosteus oculatus]|uniref:C-type mannose receptor 2-like n=1 Tax=Lepisosteus oculatus TaxID=7918 RepID=UPI00371CA0F5